MMRKTVNERICGSVNLWDPMEKVKLLNWDDLCKQIKLKSSTLLSCTDESELVHALEELVVSDVQHQAQRSRALMNKCIIIDGMAVIKAIIHTGKFRTCSWPGFQ